MGGATAAQGAHGVQPLDSRVLREGVLLEEVVLQSGVALGRMGDGVAAELDDLLAEGCDCVVSRTLFALKRDSGRVVRPKRRQSDAPLWLFAAAIVE
jgi:hypothetical protein